MKVVQHQARIEPGHLRIAEGPIQMGTRPLDGQPFPDFLILPTVFTGATLYLLLTTVSGSVLYYASRKRAAAMCIPSLKTIRFRPSGSAALFFQQTVRVSPGKPGALGVLARQPVI